MIILADADLQIPKTLCDLNLLIRHSGFALQNALVSLSPAIRRKRHPS